MDSQPPVLASKPSPSFTSHTSNRKPSDSAHGRHAPCRSSERRSGSTCGRWDAQNSRTATSSKPGPPPREATRKGCPQPGGASSSLRKAPILKARSIAAVPSVKR
eukprot:scaffold273524_cov31-Tisochrysis_lutea.AAC.5